MRAKYLIVGDPQSILARVTGFHYELFDRATSTWRHDGFVFDSGSTKAVQIDADEAAAMTHTCDRNGPPERVADLGDVPTIAVYSTCSVCGVPQVLPRASDRAAQEQENAK